MRVALVGPPQSGKSTLFAAVVGESGSAVHIERPDQPHLATVKVPDERLEWIASLVRPKKTVHAEIELLDLPGFDLSDEAGRHHARTHFAAMRQSQMLCFVVRGFAGETVPAYRGRVDPAGDVEEFVAEMLFADLDQVTQRIGKLEAAVRKPSPEREHQQHELALMKRLVGALEAEKPIAEAVHGEAEEKLLRSFAFCSLMPALVVLNCAEDDLAAPAPETLGGLPCLKLSAEIEQELAQLDPEERGEFLDDLGIGTSARDRLVRSCFAQMNLVSFFTYTANECRAWAIPAGTDAHTAAGLIHSDIARGFIRAETVAFDDLRAAGDFKQAKAVGKVRLEGKEHIVEDGDVIYFRFSV